MHGFLKKADAPLSSTGATAASPVPTPAIEPSIAPGKTGPVGIAPRTNYSRVNTGAPPQMDAGADAQKSMPPRGAEMLPKHAAAAGGETFMIAKQPLLQELVKSAMVSAAERVRVSEEARTQAAHDGGAPKTAAATVKTASAPDGDHVEKLAAACDYAAELLLKEASHVEPPPGVSQATASTTLPAHKGQGVHVVPMNPGLQKGLKTEQSATQMENTLAGGPVKGAPLASNTRKHASALDIIQAKLASDKAEKEEGAGLEEAKKGVEKAEAAHKSEPENKEAGASDLVNYMLGKTKAAEDAINPAQISAGPAVAPETMEGGQAPKEQPAGGAPQGHTELVSSAEKAIGYTKGQAYTTKRDDLKKYFVEPAMSAEHDKVLQMAFDHTREAGPKIASAAGSVKTAAARVLLSKLAEAAADETSQGASAPGTV